jgi:hypothetical protein
VALVDVDGAPAWWDSFVLRGGGDKCVGACLV